MIYFVLKAFRKDLVIWSQPELCHELNSFWFCNILFGTKVRTAGLRTFHKELL